jgi:CBS domain-containing protein
MRIKEVMTPNPICVEIPNPREEALKLLVRHNISGVPVVKSGTRKLVGILTRQDIFRKPEEEQIALLMTRDPLIVTPDTSVEIAARILYEHDVHRLPVVEHDEVVGICTPADLLKIILQKNPERQVDAYLRGDCVPIYDGTPLPVAMEILSFTESYALPVLDDGVSLVGIVTDADLFKLSQTGETLDRSTLGLGDDENVWTWDGIRNVMRFYYMTSKIGLPKEPVKKIMTTDLVTVTKHTRITEATKRMLSHDVGQLLIVDADGRLVSMLYDLDLMPSIFRE